MLRHLRYNQAESRDGLEMTVFQVNGLEMTVFQVKNALVCQLYVEINQTAERQGTDLSVNTVSKDEANYQGPLRPKTYKHVKSVKNQWSTKHRRPYTKNCPIGETGTRVPKKIVRWVFLLIFVFRSKRCLKKIVHPMTKTYKEYQRRGPCNCSSKDGCGYKHF